MPLNRASVTIASRVMLPTYPILAGGIGLNYLLKGNSLRQAGVFYEVADAIAPFTVWGVMFLTVAFIQVVAMILQRREVYMLGLGVMAGSMLVWACVGVVAAVRESGSYTAAMWPGFVVVACIASFLSLNSRET